MTHEITTAETLEILLMIHLLEMWQEFEGNNFPNFITAAMRDSQTLLHNKLNIAAESVTKSVIKDANKT